MRHDLVAFVDMRVFTAAEDDRENHLVLVLQKAAGLIDLELQIVLTRTGTNAELFCLL